MKQAHRPEVETEEFSGRLIDFVERVRDFYVVDPYQEIPPEVVIEVEHTRPDPRPYRLAGQLLAGFGAFLFITALAGLFGGLRYATTVVAIFVACNALFIVARQVLHRRRERRYQDKAQVFLDYPEFFQKVNSDFCLATAEWR